MYCDSACKFQESTVTIRFCTSNKTPTTVRTLQITTEEQEHDMNMKMKTLSYLYLLWAMKLPQRNEREGGEINRKKKAKDRSGRKAKGRCGD